MAGNKINTKKKEDKSKPSRNAESAMEENEDIDFSILRKPILTSITGFAQARKIFDSATEELKNLLSNECDMIYECKVCRNMFRSLANFISHKRIYCKDNFNSSMHGHFIEETSVMNEVSKIKKLEEGYQESLVENIDSTFENNEDLRIPITKDLTSIIEQIAKNKGVNQKDHQDKQLVFQKIPKSSVAVFQNIEAEDSKSDTMKAQMEELNDILSQENAVLQSDGKFKVQSNDVIQISDDDETEDSDILKCKICDLQFSTVKTLKYHIKYKHLENRLVYPCPDCMDIFSTSWSVYRHLFKVHRKTGAQIRRLRESIQAKAFRMNNPPAFYEKRKTVPKIVPTQKITEEERLFKENQAWLEALDGESEGRRCGGCGRAFERRAALAAHAHTCARRRRRRIQIQIRRDYNKEPHLPLADTKVQEDKDVKDNNDDEPPEAEPLDEPDEKKQETEEMETDEPVIQNNRPKFYDSTMINKLPFAQQIEKNNLNAFRQKIQLDVDLFKLLCKKCDTKYDNMDEFLNHMSNHYKWVRYACKLCNFKHFDFDKLPEHFKTVHKLKGNTEFYYSTVKAIDGAEALELSETVDEQNEVKMNETSPDSRRPSRCSSDSSRVSDDSTSSTRPETGSRKRKCNIYKTNAKRKRETIIADTNNPKEDDVMLVESETFTNNKIFEENSSDLDEVEEKTSKRLDLPPTVASRRPVRKKTKIKNADFEYDLSNLLKMEAQGYRDSQTVCTKVGQSKKKSQELQNNYDIINKDCCGAMITLSRKTVENAQGHMKTVSVPVFKTSKDSRISSIFARPMIPKIVRMDKISPKKVDSAEDSNNSSKASKAAEQSPSLSPSIAKDVKVNKNSVAISETESSQTTPQTSMDNKPKDSIIVKKRDILLNDSKNGKDGSPKCSEKDKKLPLKNDEVNTTSSTETEKGVKNIITPTKPDCNVDTNKSNLNVVPIKFRRQSLEVMKNPLIKKNITDFSKAGMKTKILVIKPIGAKVDGIQNLNNPLKFQTIKLKDPNKNSVPNEEKRSDPVVVLQMPKVDGGVTRTLPSKNIVNNKLSLATTDSIGIIDNKKNTLDVSSNKEQTSESVETKDPIKSTVTKKEKKADQVVIHIPKVDCATNGSLPVDIIKNNKELPVTKDTTTIENDKPKSNVLSIKEQTLKNDNCNKKPPNSDKNKSDNNLEDNSENENVNSDSFSDVLMDLDKIVNNDS